jgi:hypothetical protein
MNEIEIENLLFKQVDKPKNLLMVKINNVYDNRYRINVYVQIEEEGLIKKRIAQSYFCHYNTGSLSIIPDRDKKEDNKRKPGMGF